MNVTLADRAAHLQLALEEVLEQMFYLAPDGEAALPAALPEPWIASQLRFSGQASGELGVAVAPPTACLLANNFLGQECGDPTAHQLADILGELANMVAGGLLGRGTRDFAFDLSKPEPLPLTDSRTDCLICSPSKSPSVLQAAPPSGLPSSSQAGLLSCLSWPQIRLTHEIVRAYAFEGQLFLAWLCCD